MTRIQELPVETVQAICGYLRNATKERHHLAPVVETCSYMYARAAPILWSELAFVCTDSRSTIAYISILSEMLLSRAIKGPQSHPSRHTKKLTIDCPAFATHDSLSEQCIPLASSLLSQFLACLPQLAHLELDLCMAVCEARELLQQVFSSSRVARGRLELSPAAHLQVLSLVGLYQTTLPITRPQPHLRRLKLGLTCCHTPINLALFPNLEHLHLEMDCRDSDAHDFRVTPIPSALWPSLKTLVLECPAGDLDSRDVLDMLETSLSSASCVSLEAIAIFWALDASECSRLLRSLQRFAPGVTRLAWVLPGVPTPTDIELLSRHMPRLQELTLCAYMHLGAWKWTESATKYAAALARLPELRVLAVNHYQVEPESYGIMSEPASNPGASAEAYFPGKFTLECSDAALQDRLVFAEAVTQACPRLRGVTFCPVEQEHSIITVGSHTVQGDVALFWESL